MNFFHSNFFSKEKSFFFVQKIVFQMFSFWPGSDAIHPLQIAFAIFNTMEIAINGIFQINFCVKNADDLVLFLNGITPLMTQGMIVVEMSIIIAKRHSIKQIIDKLFVCFVSGENINF